MFGRYAIFHTPPPGRFADFGAAWLGWDAAPGRAVDHPRIAGIDAGTITSAPRKYGFHATLKPPFRLAPGATPQALADAVAALAATQAPVCIDGLHLDGAGGFVALIPQGDTRALADLAAATVTTLDAFRAAPTGAELTRRSDAGLTPRQKGHLAAWGYPYVFDDFRFHMTLTGPLAPQARAEVIAALGPVVAPILPRPCRIEDLTLLGQDADGMFHHIHRYALTG